MTDRSQWSTDDLDDREFPDDEDGDDANLTETCSNCGAEVYEDVEQCPVCGEYLIRATSPWSGRAWWWIALGLIGSAALIWSLVRAGF